MESFAFSNNYLLFLFGDATSVVYDEEAFQQVTYVWIVSESTRTGSIVQVSFSPTKQELVVWFHFGQSGMLSMSLIKLNKSMLQTILFFVFVIRLVLVEDVEAEVVEVVEVVEVEVAYGFGCVTL